MLTVKKKKQMQYSLRKRCHAHQKVNVSTLFLGCHFSLREDYIFFRCFLFSAWLIFVSFIWLCTARLSMRRVRSAGVSLEYPVLVFETTVVTGSAVEVNLMFSLWLAPPSGKDSPALYQLSLLLFLGLLFSVALRDQKPYPGVASSQFFRD